MYQTVQAFCPLLPFFCLKLSSVLQPLRAVQIPGSPIACVVVRHHIAQPRAPRTVRPRDGDGGVWPHRARLGCRACPSAAPLRVKRCACTG